MQLLWIELNNIRSYTKERIDFPEGSLLLSGDIGSGKSTILLAIEFSIFGVMRSHLSGNALLRHGCNQGSVELAFKIENKEIIIKRTLKRTATGIKQTAGHLILNNTKLDATPLELKAKTLQLLGYPDELVSKNKSLIFRYTVYTPQEEMLQILLESEDERLDTLRRVFGLDKYKRIRNNTALYLKELRQKRAILESKLEDEQEIKTKLKNAQQQEEELKQSNIQTKETLQNIQQQLTKLKQSLKELEKQEQDIQKARLEKETLIGTQKTLEKETILLNEETLQLNEFLAKHKITEQLTSPEQELTAIKEKIKNLNEKQRSIQEKTAFFTSKKETADNIKNKLLNIDNCPTCQQTISQQHKDHICTKQDETLQKIQNNMEKLTQANTQITTLLKNLEERESTAQTNLKTYLQKKTLQQEVKNKEKRKPEIEKRKTEIQEQTKTLQEKLSQIEKQLTQSETLITTIQQTKQEEQTHSQKEKTLLIKTTEQKERIDSLEKEIKETQEKHKKIQKHKKQFQTLTELEEWLQKLFINLLYIIEKQVLLKIHSEFDQLFQNWFSILMEDSLLSVRLDDSFSPHIIQNTHETSFLHLSGGERTSIALAYRLALNKVINDFVSTIQTKDLLILDEPTDGFSSEQLDKMRELLDELNAHQIILVSHETKIESFVDNLLHVVKDGHESKVLPT